MYENVVKQMLSQNKKRRIYDVRVKEIFETSIWWQDLWKEGTLNTDDNADQPYWLLQNIIIIEMPI
jgi:hypothetical protein